MLKKLQPKIILVLTILFFIFINILFVGPITGGDTLFHLRIGQDIFETKQIPYADYHSFTAYGAQYISQSWLSQLILFLIYKSTGFIGLQILRCLLVSGTFLLLFFTFKTPKKYLVLLLLTLIIPLAVVHNEIRPYLFSWFLSALLVFLLEKHIYKPIPIIFLFWVNLHAGFLLALGALFFYLLIEFKNTKKPYLIIIFTLSFLATFINPSTYNIYIYPSTISYYNSLMGINEWQPFKPNTPFFWLYLAYVASLLLLFIRIKNYKNNLFKLIFIIVFSAFGFISMRYPINVSILLFPILIKDLCTYLKVKHEIFIYIFCYLCLITLFFKLNIKSRLSQGIDINYNNQPVYALNFIKNNNIKDNIFNEYVFGGFLIWEQPERKVFMDGRVEVYQGQALNDYIKISQAHKGWEKILEKYNVDCTFTRIQTGKINWELSSSKDWGLVYFDDLSIIFLRNGTYPNIRRLENINIFTYKGSNKLNNSIDEYKYLLQLNPKYSGAHKILSLIYLQKGDIVNAKYHYQQYISIYPDGKKDPNLSKIKKLFGNN